MITDVSQLLKRIDEVNFFSGDSLKEKYISVLAGKEKFESTDSGLGLLKMAILSGNRLRYAILSQTENLFRFRIIVNLRLRANNSEAFPECAVQNVPIENQNYAK